MRARRRWPQRRRLRRNERRITPTGRFTPATLAFVSGKVDMTWEYSLTVPLLKDVKSQMPQAI